VTVAVNRSVVFLKQNYFSLITSEEKCNIKELGRPLPVLEIKQKQTS